MRDRKKLFALSYGPEDNTVMLQWQQKYAQRFDIVQWSPYLIAPIQAVISQHLNTKGEDCDGFLICDHSTYPDFVLAKLCGAATRAQVALYSTDHMDQPLNANC